MEIEELYSHIQGKLQPAPMGAGDMEAVEALMSMTKHWKTRSFRLRNFRPLTPSSECSEDDSVPPASTVLQDSSLVSDPYVLKVVKSGQGTKAFALPGLEVFVVLSLPLQVNLLLAKQHNFYPNSACSSRLSVSSQWLSVYVIINVLV